MKLKLAPLFLLPVLFSGCGRVPFDTPEFHDIGANQTAFLVPLEGKTSSQAKFDSESFYRSSEVALKRVQIPHRWVQTGRRSYEGQYFPTMGLILVDRTPAHRDWTETKDTGTDASNQALAAESKESIGFYTNIACTAMIKSDDAAKFLYWYSTQPLASVMDTEIKGRISTSWTEKVAQYSLDQLLTQKESIMQHVRAQVIPFFAARGITITLIGLNGEFHYIDAAIQEAINSKFQAAQDLVAQKSRNESAISQAKASEEAARILTSGPGIAFQEAKWKYELRKALIEKMPADGTAWPRVLGGNNNIIIDALKGD